MDRHRGNPTYHAYRQIVGVSKVVYRRCADCGTDKEHVTHARYLCWNVRPPTGPKRILFIHCGREAGHPGSHVAILKQDAPAVVWA
jgi:hypothetical protein